MPPKNQKPEDLEAKKRIAKEVRDKLYKEKARSLFSKSLDDDLEDEQDARVELIREASFYADMFLKSQDEITKARLNYRIANKFDNQQSKEAAIEQGKQALLNRDEAGPELTRILPLCPLGLIVNVAEWRNILLLPKEYRDLIGIKLDSDGDQSSINNGNLVEKLAGIEAT